MTILIYDQPNMHGGRLEHRNDIACIHGIRNKRSMPDNAPDIRMLANYLSVQQVLGLDNTNDLIGVVFTDNTLSWLAVRAHVCSGCLQLGVSNCPSVN